MTAVSETISLESAAPPRNRVAAIRRVLDRVLVVLFIIAIGVPMVGTWRHWDMGQKFNERRELATMPGWPKDIAQARTFLPGLMAYYRDHFGFRNFLIQGQMEAETDVSGISPNPLVALGSQGWIYWVPHVDEDFAMYRGLKPLTSSELDAWQKLFEGRQAYMAARHIPYLVVFVPDKQTIYPEFMPEAAKKIRDVSRLDQIVDRLAKANSPVHVLDLRPELLRAKSVEQVYYRGDTHWNQFGAFVGYHAIMEEVKRMLPGKKMVILGPADFERHWEERIGGDLPDVLGASEKFKERLMTLMPRVSMPVPAVPHDAYVPIITLNNPDTQLPRLIMFRDSFATALLPLMVHSFSYGYYSWGYYFDTDQIDAQKPDLVISEFTEREFDEPTPHVLGF